jgi:hypothetical protein
MLSSGDDAVCERCGRHPVQWRPRRPGQRRAGVDVSDQALCAFCFGLLASRLVAKVNAQRQATRVKRARDRARYLAQRLDEWE